MKCIICHSVDIQKKRVNEEYLVSNDIIYIPVELLVCKSCGERYYDRKTKQYLEEISKNLDKHKVELKEIGKVKILAA